MLSKEVSVGQHGKSKPVGLNASGFFIKLFERQQDETKIDSS